MDFGLALPGRVVALFEPSFDRCSSARRALGRLSVGARVSLRTVRGFIRVVGAADSSEETIAGQRHDDLSFRHTSTSSRVEARASQVLVATLCARYTARRDSWVGALPIRSAR